MLRMPATLAALMILVIPAVLVPMPLTPKQQTPLQQQTPQAMLSPSNILPEQWADTPTFSLPVTEPASPASTGFLLLRHLSIQVWMPSTPESDPLNHVALSSNASTVLPSSQCKVTQTHTGRVIRKPTWQDDYVEIVKQNSNYLGPN